MKMEVFCTNFLNGFATPDYCGAMRGEVKIQLLNFAYKLLLNKPYENEVTLTGQNITLKCYKPFEL